MTSVVLLSGQRESMSLGLDELHHNYSSPSRQIENCQWTAPPLCLVTSEAQAEDRTLPQFSALVSVLFLATRVIMELIEMLSL